MRGSLVAIVRSALLRRAGAGSLILDYVCFRRFSPFELRPSLCLAFAQSKSNSKSLGERLRYYELYSTGSTRSSPHKHAHGG